MAITSTGERIIKAKPAIKISVRRFKNVYNVILIYELNTSLIFKTTDINSLSVILVEHGMLKHFW